MNLNDQLSKEEPTTVKNLWHDGIISDSEFWAYSKEHPQAPEKPNHIAELVAVGAIILTLLIKCGVVD